MTRTKKTLSWLAGIVALVIVGIVIFVITFDWNRLKPTINQKVSTELNRPFAIRGNLGVDWSRPADETGWRSWVPWPHVHAEDIVLGNPADIPAVSMVSLERVDASLSPLALLGKQIYIPRIKLKQPDASLRRLANGKNNWTFELANASNEGQPKDQKSAWSFKIDDIVFDQGKIAYDDAMIGAKFKATIDPLGKPLPF